MNNLSALTACLWMTAADTNAGTPLGYAVPGQDNEFVIYNYQSFMLFVGGENRSVKLHMGYGIGRLLSEVADCMGPVWMMISTIPDKASKTALSFKALLNLFLPICPGRWQILDFLPTTAGLDLGSQFHYISDIFFLADETVVLRRKPSPSPCNFAISSKQFLCISQGTILAAVWLTCHACSRT